MYKDGRYQAPKHVVVPYVENTLFSTNKYSCVRRVHTLYISYYNLWLKTISLENIFVDGMIILKDIRKIGHYEVKDLVSS